MKFENAKIEIEYLNNLDIVLVASSGDADIDDNVSTKYTDDDFGLG